MGERFRMIRPGLYERIDIPRRVALSQAFIDAIRAEGCTLLNEILERMIAEDETARADGRGE